MHKYLYGVALTRLSGATFGVPVAVRKFKRPGFTGSVLKRDPPPCLRQQPRKVNGRLKNVCECSISMEKDQSVPIVPFDKPGADPDELEFEEDNEDWRPYLH